MYVGKCGMKEGLRLRDDMDDTFQSFVMLFLFSIAFDTSYTYI